MAANSCNHSSKITAASAYRLISALYLLKSVIDEFAADDDDGDVIDGDAVEEALEDIIDEYDKDDVELWLLTGEFCTDFLLLLPRNIDEKAAVIEFLVARASWPAKQIVGNFSSDFRTNMKICKFSLPLQNIPTNIKVLLDCLPIFSSN